MTDPAPLTGYAVDRFGYAPYAHVLGSLVRDVDLDSLHEAIAEHGLQAVAEQYLRTPITDAFTRLDVTDPATSCR